MFYKLVWQSVALTAELKNPIFEYFRLNGRTFFDNGLTKIEINLYIFSIYLHNIYLRILLLRS